VEERKRILIVDDNHDNVEIIKYKIERSDTFKFEVLVAFSGQQAIETASREQLDIVLLDVMMPGISGFEVCRRIKEIKGDVFLPIPRSRDSSRAQTTISPSLSITRSSRPA